MIHTCFAKKSPWVQFDLILVQILVELFSAEHLGYSDQLVVVVVTVKERLLPENHGGEHAAQGPHVQAVVVHLVVNEQLGSLEVTTGHSHIILLVKTQILCPEYWNCKTSHTCPG